MTAGLLFSGMAIGPWLGGRIIHYTGDLLSVFYFAAAVHILGGVYWILCVPESLPKHVRRANLAAQKERKAKQRAEGGLFIWHLFGFLQPLKMLLPKPVDKNNLRKGWDWNLTLLALAHAFAIMMMGSYPYKMTYAQQQFGWGAEEVCSCTLSFASAVLTCCAARHFLVDCWHRSGDIPPPGPPSDHQTFQASSPTYSTRRKRERHRGRATRKHHSTCSRTISLEGSRLPLPGAIGRVCPRRSYNGTPGCL